MLMSPHPASFVARQPQLLTVAALQNIPLSQTSRVPTTQHTLPAVL